MVDSRRAQLQNDAPVGEGPVLYLMAREQRVEDNWALLYAAERAQARNVALMVAFVLGPAFNHFSARHNDWLVASLREVATECAARGIPFTIACGNWAETSLSLVRTYAAGEVVLDFNPLQPVRGWREEFARACPVRVTVVDARNIIPCFYASDKAEFAAYTFRPKVHRLVPEFLTPFPALPTMPSVGVSLPAIDWEAVAAFRPSDARVPLPAGFQPGAKAGQAALADFLANRLVGYATHRNDPTLSATSRLSPYLRWGNLSAQRVALAVRTSEAPREDRDAYLEELIVRRELSDNYVYYTEHYDTLAGAHAWAQKTLTEHRGDARSHTYTIHELEAAKTHDELWNAMQRQMVTEGTMHGWCRMYWAKKILEWTKDPEEAISIALTLNDRYELDGRDSNGVVGVMWSIAGVHDRAWTERPIFGKIRYMNFNGAKRKFDVAAYVAAHPETDSTLFS